MKRIILSLCATAALGLYAGDSFVVKKKRKELAVSVKQDIGQQLEQTLTRLGKVIKKSVTVQSQVYEKVKELLGESDEKTCFDGSTAELKKIRLELQKFDASVHQLMNQLDAFSDCF